MPSRIEELIARFRDWNSTQMTPLTCADELERAYREEVVPMVKMFYRLKVEAAYAKQFVDNSLAAADLEKAIEDSAAVLRRFDAPAGTEPPANPKPAAEEPRT